MVLLDKCTEIAGMIGVTGYLLKEGDPLSVSQLATCNSISIPQARRILKLFAEFGIVKQNEDYTYSLAEEMEEDDE